MALRRSPRLLGAEDFPRDLLDLMGMLGDVRGEGGMWERFSATPAAMTSPQILLLGSSGFSAELAGRLGLPFVFAHHFDQGGTLEALDLYRDAFRPSVALERPHVIVTANVLVARTDEEADWEAGPGRLMSYRIRSGRFAPLLSPDAAAAEPDMALARRAPTNRVVGAPAAAAAQLDALVSATAADELMVTTVAHDLAVRLRSLELLAAEWPLGLPAPPVDQLVEGDAGR
jgi:luciferase family oxidoreductase group 1